MFNDDFISEVGRNGIRGNVGENESVVRKRIREEIIGALKEKKGVKAVSLDSIVAKTLETGVISTTDGLVF